MKTPMKTPMKRLLALILAMAMCLSLLSASVWAAETSEADADVSVTEEVEPEEEASASEESEAADEEEAPQAEEVPEVEEEEAPQAEEVPEAEEEEAPQAEEVPEVEEEEAPQAEEVPEVEEEKVPAAQETVASVRDAGGNETAYDNLTNAVSNWGDGCTLVILVNHNITSPFTIGSGKSLEIAQGVTVGSNSDGSITNNGTLIVKGTLDATVGTISQAGTVEVDSTGKLKLKAPLPTTAEMTIQAGGEVEVALPDGQGGTVTQTFIGKSGSTAIATLESGTIAFSLTPQANSYTLAANSVLNVYQWDTGNALFGATTKTVENNGTINVLGTMHIGQNTTLKNADGVLNAVGTLDASQGIINEAGKVTIDSTGKLICAAPLPTTAEMTIKAGGEVAVVMPDGKGGTVTQTFIGKSGSTAIATLEKGSIAFTFTPAANTYTLADGGVLNVYQWDTGNALFGATTKTVENNGTINVLGTMHIGQNTTLKNADGVLNAVGTLDASQGIINEAGKVTIDSTGKLICAAPLPTTAEMTIKAGGEVAVVMPDGKGGTVTQTFIGKSGSTAIATLEKGSIAFTFTPAANTYTLADGGVLNVYQWDTGNALFGAATKTVENNGTINVLGTMHIGQNTTLKNADGVLNAVGTLDASQGIINEAGKVTIDSTGKLICAAPLPTTAEMTIKAGGEVAVVMPDGQGGTVTQTFIGKSGSTAIATLEKGSIAFTFTPAANTYTLADGGVLNVYQWDTGNALFGAATKTVENNGTINVLGTMHIGQNTTLNNTGTLALAAKNATVVVVEASKGALTVANSDGGVHSGTGAEAKTVYSYSDGVVSQLKKNKITASNKTKTWSKKKQTVKLGAKAKGGAKLSYKSNNKKVTVSSSGKVTIPAKFTGKVKITITSAKTTEYKKTTKTVTVTVKPTGTKLSSVKVSKNRLQLTWKKNESGKGYQVQYATDKAFKKNVKKVKIDKKGTLKLTIKGLKKGTYYVRIRTVNGAVSSSWSGKKSAKVK